MMVRAKKEDYFEPLPPPATTLEGREEQLVAAAMDLAERRIQEGTASAQEVVHFLRQGTVTAQLQNAKLKAENEVLHARVKDMENRTTGEEMYTKALQAFRGYAGLDPVDPEANDFDDY